MCHPWKLASFEAFLERQLEKFSAKSELVQD
jgi:hypothetical protein